MNEKLKMYYQLEDDIKKDISNEVIKIKDSTKYTFRELAMISGLATKTIHSILHNEEFSIKVGIKLLDSIRNLDKITIDKKTELRELTEKSPYKFNSKYTKKTKVYSGIDPNKAYMRAEAKATMKKLGHDILQYNEVFSGEYYMRKNGGKTKRYYYTLKD